MDLKDSGINGYIDTATLVPLVDSRSVAILRCPLDGTVYQKSSSVGRLCDTCMLCKLGEDAVGLQNIVDIE